MSEHSLARRSELALSFVDYLGFVRPLDFSEGFLKMKLLINSLTATGWCRTVAFS